MKEAKIKFHILSLFVKDLDKSIHFYKRLGFIVNEIGEGDTYTFCDIKLPSNNCFTIRLKQTFAGERRVGEICIEFMADEEKGISHVEAQDDLLNYGFKFTNIEPWEMYKANIFSVVQLEDPDGCCLRLVDCENECYD